MSSESEREALAKVIDDAADVPVSPERVRTSLSLWLADAILAAGFRRTEPSSEVPEPSADDRIVRAIEVLSWRPDHDGVDPARVQDDYMRRAQAADAALAILTENREGAF